MNERSNEQPGEKTRSADLLELAIYNQKLIVTEMTKSHLAALYAKPVPDQPGNVGLRNQVLRYEDFETDWFIYWMKALKLSFRIHRKFWEFAFICQTLFENGMLASGKTGLGLGCGTEWLPSCFISKGCIVTAGDKPVREEGWGNSNQYTENREALFKEQYLSKEQFDASFTLKYVDMNHLDPELYGKFDFCWSVCVVEHLGSIRQGLDFLRNSLKLLKPGGVSVHTTEYNYLNDPYLIDNSPAVIFHREHLEQLSMEVESFGSPPLELDLSVGSNFYDRYIDLPPYLRGPIRGIDCPLEEMVDIKSRPHLRLLYSGTPITNVGIVIKKAGD